MSQHIEEHPIVDYPSRTPVTFSFDGRTLTGLAGQPIAAALLDNGISVFRHTHKTGQCSDCVVVVNGTPNVRSCTTPLVEGMVIETQHGLGKVGVL